DERIKSMLDGEERAREAETRFQKLGAGMPGPSNRRPLALRDDDLEERFRRAIVDKSPAPIEVYPTERRSWYQPGVEYRVLGKGTATQALPVDVYDRILAHLVENSAVMAAGATVINTETGENLQVPRSTAFVSSALTAEGTAATLSDPTLGIATLGAFK